MGSSRRQVQSVDATPSDLICGLGGAHGEDGTPGIVAGEEG